jgi:hypothetical protein
MAPVLLVLAMSGTAVAQSGPASSGDQSETMQQLLNRLDQLERRVKELEGQHATAAAAANEAEAAERSPEVQAADAMGHGSKESPLPALQIRGYGDVRYRASNIKGDTNTFTLGQLDLFMTSRLADKWSYTSELVFEAGENNSYGLDLERLLLQYSPSEYFNIAGGRYHTAIGYYNTAYHHGTWFQTTVDRPFIFAFEDGGGILPIHGVGLTANGRIPSGRAGLRYVAEVSNGRASSSLLSEPVQNVRDENNGKAVNFALLARPERLPGFQTGISVYRDKLTPDGLPNMRQTITAAHVVYQRPEFEFLNEGLLIRNSVQTAPQTFNTTAFYSQISKAFGRARPYFRYEFLNAPKTEPVFTDIGLRHGPLLGFRYDVSDYAAFKIQYDRLLRRQLIPGNGLNLQLAFTF